jgi:hypothetical protein
MRSPDVVAGIASVYVCEGFKSAGAAYNDAIDHCSAAYLVLLHQDVYLPGGFVAELEHRIEELNAHDPNWAIAGTIGMDRNNLVHGQVWSSGMNAMIGKKLDAPAQVETLDELLLVLRVGSGLRFSSDLPGFHMFGTDIVQVARTMNMKSYALQLPVIHHSRRVVGLGKSYWSAYRYLRRKWRRQLPLPNLVCPVHKSMLPLLRREFLIRTRYRGKTRGAAPISNPAEIAQQLGLDAT